MTAPRSGKPDVVAEYRSVPIAMEDTPAWQALTGWAQRVWYALKVRLPVTGINTCYAAELLPRLGRDATLDRVEAGIGELIDARLVMRDGVVMWLVDALAQEPYLTPNDPKHRKAVQRRLASLPPNALADAFARRYAAYFVDVAPPSPTAAAADAVGRGSEAPAKGLGSPVGHGHGLGPAPAPADGHGPGPGGPGGAAPPATAAPATGSGGTTTPPGQHQGQDGAIPASGGTPAGCADDGPRVPVNVGRILARSPGLAAWCAGDADHRRPLLRRVLRRVADEAGAEPHDVHAYAGAIEAALGGVYGMTPSDVELADALTDWTTNRPPLGLRLFRNYLTAIRAPAERRTGKPSARKRDDGESPGGAGGGVLRVI